MKGGSNAELLEDFKLAMQGKMTPGVLSAYAAGVKDAMAFFREEGREVHVREWTKDGVWRYAHFVEQNYCASFVFWPYRPTEALCRQRVWVGSKEAAAAAREHCATCSLFRGTSARGRLLGINRFFRYLARIGVVPLNFVSDVMSEYYEDNPRDQEHVERRRNPTVEEQRALVNGTTHPQNRAFYAASAKWWARPNEMFLLDRYASFGLPMPDGLPRPNGFENGFLAHPQLASFENGGELVYIPEKGAIDKRQGNRWLVVDAELRPILEQHFAWWERTVRRDRAGTPRTTSLWLTKKGHPLLKKDMYLTLFHADTMRLGLVTPEERLDRRRVWTAHCQRHFGEKLLEMHDVPDSWCNHFRGDKFRDARGAYFKPTPEQIRQKYFEFVPRLGFKPVPDPAILSSLGTGQREASIAILKAELDRLGRAGGIGFSAAKIVIGSETIVVPRRAASAFLFAAKTAFPGTEIRLELRESGGAPQRPKKKAYREVVTRALAWIG